MAQLSFKDYITVDYRPGEPEEVKYRAHKRKRNSNLNGVEEENDVEEELSVTGRRKLARATKRRKTMLKIARKRALKKMANKQTLSKRARRSARGQFADKLAGKGNKKSDVSVAKKKQIEKRLSQGGWQQRIAILQRRMMPQKRKQEIMRKR